jgi:PAS domain S-box-containing protein
MKTINPIANKDVYPDPSHELYPLISNIAKVSSSFVTCNTREDVFTLIGEATKDISCSITLISDFDENDETYGVFYTAGMSKMIRSVTQVTGYDPLKKRVSANKLTEEEKQKFHQAQMEILPGGLYTFALKSIPRTVCNAISKILGIKYVYSRGLVFDGVRYGSVSILSPRIIDDHQLNLIDQLSDVASAVLQRIVAKDRLHKSEEKYRLLAENTRDVIWTMDLDLRFTYISPSSQILNGYTSEQQLNMGIDELLEPESFKYLMQVFQEELANEKKAGVDPRRTRILEFQEACADGSYKWVESQISFLRDADGNATGILGVSRDISKRKNIEENLVLSEESLRTTIDAISDSIYVIDASYRFTLVNSGFRKWCKKMKIKGPFLSKNILEVFSNTTLQGINEYDEVFRSGREITSEQSFEIESGFTVTEIRKIPIIEDGQVKKVLTIVRDITNSRRMEGEIHEKESQLREIMHRIQNMNVELERRVAKRTASLKAANEELESFTYTVSHDLRAPLRSINGYANILMDEYKKQLDAEGQELLKSIIGNASRMGSLIDDLLEFSRTGKRDLRFKRVDMRKLCLRILQELIRPDIAKRTQVIMRRLPVVSADEKMLHQVLSNLLSNAIKYSSKRSCIRLEIGGEHADHEIVYYVKDNGVGFDMKYYGKLFGVFQRLHNSSEFEGTGVGLAIVKQIVDLHGGRVWAESIPGQGAAFYFALPSVMRHEEPIKKQP